MASASCLETRVVKDLSCKDRLCQNNLEESFYLFIFKDLFVLCKYSVLILYVSTLSLS